MDASRTGYVFRHDIPLGGDGDDWKQAGHYWIWTRSFEAGHPELLLLQRIDGRVVTSPATPYSLHNVAAGTPYRIAGLFGFWRTSQGDTVFLKTTGESAVSYSLLINSASAAYRNDRVGWFCPHCGQTIHEAVIATRRLGLVAFWQEAGRLAEAFNADPVLRTCPGCSTQHPPAYGFGVSGDDAERGAALRDVVVPATRRT